MIDSTAAFAQLLDTLAATTPETATACSGWSVHELVAHLAAGSAEIADLVEAAISGDQDRATRPFTTREAPYRALEPTALYERLMVEAGRVVDALARLENDRCVSFTGVSMSGPSLLAHATGELVLHRWDITGDDEIAINALRDPDLVSHLVEHVVPMHPNVVPTRRGRTPGAILIRARGDAQRDVVVEAGKLRWATADDSGAEVVELDPAARTLALWGRHATSPERAGATGRPEVVEELYSRLGVRPLATT